MEEELQLDDKKLYKEVSDLDIIPKGALDEAYEFSKNKKRTLYNVLLDKDLISDENLGKVIADILKKPFIYLSNVKIDDDVLSIVPEVVARKQGIIAFKKDEKGLHLAMMNPDNKRMIEFIEKKIGINVVVYFATQRDIEQSLSHYAKDIKEVFNKIINENLKNAGKKTKEKEDPSIIKIIDTTILYAYQNRASDIHIEPSKESTLVRFRIDGVMHDVVDLPLSLHDQIVMRVKVISHLRTDEHLAPQDGKITYELEQEDLDIRVSIVPITDGEKVVMRLLSEKSRRFSLSDLGFSDDNLKKLQEAYEKPHGMILATGPTGSGKTTTLYSILKLLNKRDVNLMTIEDPVEYDIEGINQIQVNPKTNLTFAAGLRSIVRQDPDIVLVGEIRDEETADVSINAAMTGHLVLSTLHTNDAATTLPRMIDLEVEPFLVASTVNIIVAQRLVRKICQTCRVSGEIDKIKKKMLVKDKEYGTHISKTAIDLLEKYYKETDKVRVYFGKGCEVCHHTGYSGRIGIYEVLLINEEIRQLIIDRADASKIKKAAIDAGMATIQDDGMEKVKLGVTTIEEVMRVTKE